MSSFDILKVKDDYHWNTPMVAIALACQADSSVCRSKPVDFVYPSHPQQPFRIPANQIRPTIVPLTSKISLNC